MYKRMSGYVLTDEMQMSYKWAGQKKTLKVPAGTWWDGVSYFPEFKGLIIPSCFHDYALLSMTRKEARAVLRAALRASSWRYAVWLVNAAVWIYDQTKKDHSL